MKAPEKPQDSKETTTPVKRKPTKWQSYELNPPERQNLRIARVKEGKEHGQNVWDFTAQLLRHIDTG